VKKKAKATTRARKPASPSFRLKAASTRDVKVWKAMRSDLFSGLELSFHTREIKQILASRDRTCLFVIAPNGNTAGFLEVSLRNLVDGCMGGPVGYIEAIYLVPEFRGLGLGGVLIEALGQWFASKGCRDMATDTEIDNEDAQEFWSELGFEETWRVVQYRKPLPKPRRRKASPARSSRG
jgi:aminoglycoside 6'-N-acetyltransferase I